MTNHSKPKYSKHNLIVDKEGNFCDIPKSDLRLNLSNIDRKTLLCPMEVAYILRVSRRTVERLCHDGKLLYLKVNRAVRVSVAALLHFIEANEVGLE